jgi:glycosyltransferase involved in cell wall biosynthesis
MNADVDEAYARWIERSDPTHVTIVTPVHNGAAYLEQSIRSALLQTHTNWSHVIMDNASTDATPDIATRYAADDSRVRYVRSDDFVGVIENHNRAFALADSTTGWCKPLHADDVLFPNCLEEMLKAASLSRSIALVSAYQREGDRVHLTHLPIECQVFGGRDILRLNLTGIGNVTGGPTAVMYRSDVVVERTPFQEEALEHADTDVAFRILSTHDLGFVHQVLSFARRQGNTQTDWSARMGTWLPENVLFILRYGPSSLAADEWRAALRVAVRKYVWHQAKQAIRPSRLADRDFYDYHVRAVQLLRNANTSNTAEVRWATRFVEVLLARRVVGDHLPSIPIRRG